MANTNLDDGKQTKKNLLGSLDIDYQNSLRAIYNIDIEDNETESPLFKAIRVPGRDFIPEATDPEPHDQNRLEEVDQGGA